MLVLKYNKIGDARFISHIDILNHMVRTIRRANIPVKFSQGFNPHALVFFSPPIVLGIGSEAEYLSIDTDMPAEKAFAAYNNSVPEGLRATAYFVTDKNPNLQGKVVAADYIFPTAFEGINLGDNFEITYEKKGESVTEKVGDKIFRVFDADGRLGMRLASGNSTLRADRIALQLKRDFGRDIVVPNILKTAQYALSADGVQTLVDDSVLSVVPQ